MNIISNCASSGVLLRSVDENPDDMGMDLDTDLDLLETILDALL